MRKPDRLGAGNFPILERVDGNAEFRGGLRLVEPFALSSCLKHSGKRLLFLFADARPYAGSISGQSRHVNLQAGDFPINLMSFSVGWMKPREVFR